MTLNTIDLWHFATAQLLRANADKKHPFRRCVLNTHGEYPESRWVVLRQISDDLSFIIYTDSRSPKVHQILSDDRASLVFFHQKKQLQIRVKARASVILEGQEYELHAAKAANYPKDYSTALPPGTALYDRPATSDTMHFAVLKLIPVEWDILLLSRDQHSRAIFTNAEGRWLGETIVP